jgi:hypothetical protein
MNQPFMGIQIALFIETLSTIRALMRLFICMNILVLLHFVFERERFLAKSAFKFWIFSVTLNMAVNFQTTIEKLATNITFK